MLHKNTINKKQLACSSQVAIIRTYIKVLNNQPKNYNEIFEIFINHLRRNHGNSITDLGNVIKFNCKNQLFEFKYQGKNTTIAQEMQNFIELLSKIHIKDILENSLEKAPLFRMTTEKTSQCFQKIKNNALIDFLKDESTIIDLGLARQTESYVEQKIKSYIKLFKHIDLHRFKGDDEINKFLDAFPKELWSDHRFRILIEQGELPTLMADKIVEKIINAHIKTNKQALN